MKKRNVKGKAGVKVRKVSDDTNQFLMIPWNERGECDDNDERKSVTNQSTPQFVSLDFSET